MPPVALPVLSADLKRRVNYPRAPGNPPSDKDLAGGIRLAREVYDAVKQGEADEEALVKCWRFQNQMFAVDEEPGAAPAWFDAAMARALAPMQANMGRLENRMAAMENRMAGMEQRMTGMEHRMTRMEHRMDRLDRQLGLVRRMAAKTWNANQGSGRHAELEIVPFPTGADPTAEPHNLPALNSPAAIRALNAAHRDAYFQGYFPEAVGVPQGEKVARILLAVGAGFGAA